MHPNQENEAEVGAEDSVDIETGEEGKKLSDQNEKTCGYYFKTLDEMIIRPLLIYKYEKKSMKDIDEIMELIASDQNAMQEIYRKMSPLISRDQII